MHRWMSIHSKIAGIMIWQVNVRKDDMENAIFISDTWTLRSTPFSRIFTCNRRNVVESGESSWWLVDRRHGALWRIDKWAVLDREWHLNPWWNEWNRSPDRACEDSANSAGECFERVVAENEFYGNILQISHPISTRKQEKYISSMEGLSLLPHRERMFVRFDGDMSECGGMK